jgi:hypothetical protein
MTDTNTAQMAADLTSTNGAVVGNGWVSPGLGGSGGSLGLLGSTSDPLSGLASAGFGWFTSLVSFLGDGLTQLQGGNAASVTSGSQNFGNAGQSITNLASSYGASTSAQTASWTGTAATDYRNAAAQHATGVAGLGAASTTTGSAIIGAGQVVAEAIAQVTELISEAVAQIVPILSQAVARASQTFGESIVEAIPPCVGIAVEYAARIAAKLAALLASGQNLLKLVQGALGVVDLIQQALSSISQQSTQAGTQPTPTAGAGQPQAVSPASTVNSGNTLGAADSGNTGATAPTSPGGGGASTPSGLAGSGGSADPATSANLGGSANLGASAGADQLGVAPQSAAVVQPFQGTMPNASPYPVHADGGQVSTGAVPGGALPVGAAGIGLAAGARSGAGRGADTVRQDRTLPPSPTSTGGRGTPDGVPLGGMGGVRAGETDKEHKRKYSVVEQHDEVLEVVPPVITSGP